MTAGPAIRASLLLLAACTGPSPDTDPVDTDTGTVDTDVPDTDVPDPRGGNVVVLVSDDIGAERTGAYGAQAYPTFTPNLDALAAQGVRFTNAYASPTCSPTRASLLTGRLPTRTGIGRWLFAPNAGFDLDPAEVTLAEMLALADPPYASAAVGKWHVVSFLRDDFANHPLAQGFSRHRGSLSNPREAVQEGNFPRGYENWEKNTDGALAWSTTYMTTDTVDEALDAIDTMPEPWFLYLALNAAHEPWHVPPAALNTLGVQAGAPDADLYDADILAADAEIGRFLDSLDPAVRDDLTIVYLADNGTPCPVVRPPYDPTRCKGTVYEGGVRVPLIVTGPWVAVPGSTSDALVHVVDVFPTLADIAGVDVDGLVGTEGAAVGLPLGLDGFSLLPLLADPTDPGPRETVFTEGFFPNGDARWTERGRTIRSATHKLVRLDDPAGTTEAFFALEPGALDEGPDLIGTALSPGDQAALDGLRAEMDAMDAALTFGW